MTRITVPTEMTPEQKLVAERIAKSLGAVRGPYSAWIHRPELASRIHHLTDYFRNDAAIPSRLRMLAVLLTIRHWGAEYPWSVQVPHGLDAGLSPATVTAVGEGKTPSFTEPDEEIVHRVATELLERHAVSDSTYRLALDRLGQPAFVELIAVIGHFSLISLTAVAFDIHAIKSPPVPLSKN